jgi:hypothetical protein
LLFHNNVVHPGILALHASYHLSMYVPAVDLSGVTLPACYEIFMCTRNRIFDESVDLAARHEKTLKTPKDGVSRPVKGIQDAGLSSVVFRISHGPRFALGSYNLAALQRRGVSDAS